MSLVYALVTVVAWGVWLLPSQRIPMKGQQSRTFYVTLAVLMLALAVGGVQRFAGLHLADSLLPFLGGLIWSVSGLCAFIGANKLGMAKAFGIWAPLNIVVSILWGMTLFGEFLHSSVRSAAICSVALLAIICGTLLIVLSGGKDADPGEGHGALIGVLGAVGAGVGFGSYFIPIRISGMSVWVATLPLSIGMFVGATITNVLTASMTSLRLERPEHYMRVLLTGVLWGIGNYGALLMMERIGTGRGFTIAQLCVVVNALLGVFWERKPAPGTREANLTLTGVVVATVGGIVLGNLK